MTDTRKWNRVTDVRAFLAERGTRNVGAHNPKQRKRLPWPVCSRCGLLYLRNEATRRAVRAACVVEE